MAIHDTMRHSFIIRLWAEEITRGGQVYWRGHITHVLSGKQSYIEDMDTIPAFIKPFLSPNQREGSIGEAQAPE